MKIELTLSGDELRKFVAESLEQRFPGMRAEQTSLEHVSTYGNNYITMTDEPAQPEPVALPDPAPF